MIRDLDLEIVFKSVKYSEKLILKFARSDGISDGQLVE